MEIINLSIEQIREAPCNPNSLDEEMLRRLRRSIEQFNLVTPLAVRQIEPGLYETLSGAQRLAVLSEMGNAVVTVVRVNAHGAEARLLGHAPNAIGGQDQ